MTLRTWPFRILAWLEASLMAATALAIELALFGVGHEILTSQSSSGMALIFATFAGLFSLPAFMGGFASAGAAVWWLMNSRKRTSSIEAALAGAAGCTAAGVAALWATSGIQQAPMALFLAAPGAVAGWVAQRVGYDRT